VYPNPGEKMGGRNEQDTRRELPTNGFIPPTTTTTTSKKASTKRDTQTHPYFYAKKQQNEPSGHRAQREKLANAGHNRYTLPTMSYADPLGNYEAKGEKVNRVASEMES